MVDVQSGIALTFPGNQLQEGGILPGKAPEAKHEAPAGHKKNLSKLPRFFMC
jgi:hypothetical protein